MEYSSVDREPKEPGPSKSEIVAALLRRLRTDAGLRQEELGDRLNRSQSYVSKYENCERGLDVVELLEICDALGITLGTFAYLLEAELAR